MHGNELVFSNGITPSPKSGHALPECGVSPGSEPVTANLGDQSLDLFDAWVWYQIHLLWERRGEYKVFSLAG